MSMSFTRKMTKVSLGLGALAVMGYAGYQFANSEVTSRYEPRQSSDVVAGAHGSFEYINQMRANQITGVVDPADELAARAQALAFDRMFKTNLGLEWEEKGPNNFGGRTRAFLIDKDNRNLLFAGSVSGGLFRSNNAGASWVVVNDQQENLAVVSICQTTNGDIYYGTGEGMYTGTGGTGGSGTLGGGVFKSTDGGQTFARLQSTIPTPNSTATQWAAVGKLIAHKTDANTLWAATNSGLFKTTDGGQTWAIQASNLLPNTSPVQDMHQATDGSMWVSFSLGRLIYSPDGEDNWVEISKQAAGPTDIGRNPLRMGIATSPQDPNYVYVVQSIRSGTAGDVLHGVWRSTDKGQNWTKIGTKAAGFDPFVARHGTSPSRGQANYDLDIVVPNTNKDRVLVSGVDLWDWELNKNWRKLTQWNAFRLSPIYVHADHHRLVYDPSRNTTVYLSTDGGVFRSENDGLTWSEINRNYATIQFYAFDVNEARHIMGGTQDNGTFLLNGQGNTPNAAFDIFGGDGGYCAFSRLDPQMWVLETQYGSVRRTENGGESYASPFNNRVAPPAPSPGPGEPGFAPFVAPFLLYETVNDLKSVDSVDFIADPGIVSLGFGNGSERTFSGTVRRPQSTANFITTTFQVVSGGFVLTADAQGNLTGDGTGTFDPANGEFTVTFNNAPFAEIIATCDVNYDNGAIISVSSNINQLPYKYTLPRALSPSDTIRVQDPVQSVLFFGNNGRSGGLNGFGGIWMTRDAHNFTRTPVWFRIAAFQAGESPKSMAISKDGNTLFVGTAGGAVYRINNINDARSLATGDLDMNDSTLAIESIRIANFNGRAVTGIAVDPNDANNVVVTLGNYGNSVHVFHSISGLAASPNFVPKMGTGLPNMPVYGAVINQHNSNEVVLATEFGIYSTTNINAPNVVWSKDNTGMPNVPVFFIKQFINDRASSVIERTDANGNVVFDTIWAETGDIYAGTHGRGMFKTGSTLTRNTISTNDAAPQLAAAKPEKGGLRFFPNPATTHTHVELEIENRTDVTIAVRDLNGRLIKMMQIPALNRGVHKLKVETDDMKPGLYFITTLAEGVSQTGKLQIRR
jgi:hypothetical protein